MRDIEKSIPKFLTESQNLLSIWGCWNLGEVDTGRGMKGPVEIQNTSGARAPLETASAR